MVMLEFGRAALLFCLVLSWAPSAEALVTSNANIEASKRRSHHEISSYVVHDHDLKSANDEAEEDDDEETQQVLPLPGSEQEVGQGVGPRVHAAEKSMLQKAVKDAEEKIAGNEAEQMHIEATMAHLKDSSANNKEMDERAKVVANETGSSAMGIMFAKMWKELRMFEVPSFTKHVNSEISVLNEDKKGLEARLEKAQANLLAAEQEAKDAAEKDVAKPHPNFKDAILVKSLITASKPILGEIDPINVTPPPEHTSAKVNVWGMPSSSQRTVFIGSIVYLILGICFAYLYKEGRNRYPKSFLPEARPEVFPSSAGFTFPLFEFWADQKLCLLGCCCPFLRWSHTMDAQGLLSYWKAFFSIFGLLLLHVYTYGISDIGVIVLGVFYRQKLRNRFAIESGTSTTIMYDVLTWLCCQPCAIIQEAREGAVQRGIEPV